MREIIITPNPTHPDAWRDFSAGDPYIERGVTNWIKRERINPNQYPTACDLCAGEGYIALLLESSGWRGITCIDLGTPQNPFIHDGLWLTWDLIALGEAIANKEKLPTQVEEYREKFDLATMVLGIDDYVPEVLGFFVKPGGLVCPHPWQDVLESRYSRHRWTRLSDKSWFFRKNSTSQVGLYKGLHPRPKSV